MLQARNVRVWYDQFSLKVGDRLTDAINAGLARSRFGVVVLSRSFLKKQWTKRELSGLFALEGTGRKVILPVWHGIGRDDLLNQYPELADRLAAQASSGIESVADTICAVVLQGTKRLRAAAPNPVRKPVSSVIGRVERELSRRRSQLAVDSFNLGLTAFYWDFLREKRPAQDAILKLYRTFFDRVFIRHDFGTLAALHGFDEASDESAAGHIRESINSRYEQDCFKLGAITGRVAVFEAGAFIYDDFSLEGETKEEMSDLTSQCEYFFSKYGLGSHVLQLFPRIEETAQGLSLTAGINEFTPCVRGAFRRAFGSGPSSPAEVEVSEFLAETLQLGLECRNAELTAFKLLHEAFPALDGYSNAESINSHVSRMGLDPPPTEMPATAYTDWFSEQLPEGPVSDLFLIGGEVGRLMFGELVICSSKEAEGIDEFASRRDKARPRLRRRLMEYGLHDLFDSQFPDGSTYAAPPDLGNALTQFAAKLEGEVLRMPI